MPLLIEGRLLVIEVPKTGSTWVQRASRDAGLDVVPFSGRAGRHGTLRDFLASSAQTADVDVASLEVAVTARRLDDWITSIWRYYGLNGWGPMGGPVGDVAPRQEVSSHDFLVMLTGSHAGAWRAVLDGYYQRLLWDHVIWAHDLSGGLARALQAVGARAPLAKLQVHPPVNVNARWGVGQRVEMTSADVERLDPDRVHASLPGASGWAPRTS